MHSRWMLYLAVAITLLQSFLVNVPMLWASILGDTGRCNGAYHDANTVSVRVYSIFEATWMYVTVLSALIFFYGRILVKLRKANIQVAPANSVDVEAASGGQQTEGMNRSQVNVIKTMIIISTSYALTSFLYFFGYVVLSYDISPVLSSLTCITLKSDFSFSTPGGWIPSFTF